MHSTLAACCETMMTRMLEVRGLKVHFNTGEGVLQAVDGVDHGISAGETLGVVGEPGLKRTRIRLVGDVPWFAPMTTCCASCAPGRSR